MTRPKLDMIDLLNAEFREESTSALGRIGRKLEAAIGEARALGEQLDVLPPGPERAAVFAKYEAARRESETFRYYLEVQREAMGLRQHGMLDSVYPLPPRRLP
jgi:hypothetical protein